MNFKEFLVEREKKLLEKKNKFSKVDCSDKENLTDEERKYCKEKEGVEFIRKSYTVNS